MKHLFKVISSTLLFMSTCATWAENNALETLTLNTVVVSASRNEMPLERVGSSLTVITEKDIQERGYTNLADLLRTTPGIAVSNSGGAGGNTAIRIRGEEGFRTKILIDGIDVSDPSNTQIQPQVEHISLANIERIEVLRGPQGMMYGADAGGVINIVTKQAHEPFSAGGSAEYGRYDTSKVSGYVSGKNDRFDYSLLAAQNSTNGFNSRATDTVLHDADGYDNTTLNGRFGLNLTDKLRAQLTVRDVDADHDYDNCGFPTTHDCEDEFDQASQKMDLSYADDLLSHTLSYSTTDIERKFITDGVPQGNNYEGKREQVQYMGTWLAGEGNTLLYGIDQTEDRVDDDGAGGESERDQTGLYTEWQGTAVENFFYTVGVRNDDNDDFGNHTTYRTTAAWVTPLGADTLKYKASYGTGLRAPSLYEIAYNQGPWAYPPASLVTLDEETSEGFDIGMEWHGASGATAEAVYFNQDTDDAIYFDLSGYSGYLQESGTTNSQGVELSADVPVTELLSLVGNYTYNDTETSTGDQRIRRPRHYGSVGTRFSLDKFSLLANMRFANDAEDEIFGLGRVKLDDYQVFDLSANYALSETLEVFARGENIFDNDYEEVSGYNTAGPAFYAGIRASY